MAVYPRLYSRKDFSDRIENYWLVPFRNKSRQRICMFFDNILNRVNNEKTQQVHARRISTVIDTAKEGTITQARSSIRYNVSTVSDIDWVLFPTWIAVSNVALVKSSATPVSVGVEVISMVLSVAVRWLWFLVVCCSLLTIATLPVAVVVSLVDVEFSPICFSIATNTLTSLVVLACVLTTVIEDEDLGDDGDDEGDEQEADVGGNSLDAACAFIAFLSWACCQRVSSARNSGMSPRESYFGSSGSYWATSLGLTKYSSLAEISMKAIWNLIFCCYLLMWMTVDHVLQYSLFPRSNAVTGSCIKQPASSGLSKTIAGILTLISRGALRLTLA